MAASVRSLRPADEAALAPVVTPCTAWDIYMFLTLGDHPAQHRCWRLFFRSIWQSLGEPPRPCLIPTEICRGRARASGGGVAGATLSGALMGSLRRCRGPTLLKGAIFGAYPITVALVSLWVPQLSQRRAPLSLSQAVARRPQCDTGLANPAGGADCRRCCGES